MTSSPTRAVDDRAEAQRRLLRVRVVDLKHREVAALRDDGHARRVGRFANLQADRCLAFDDMGVGEYLVVAHEEAGASRLTR